MLNIKLTTRCGRGGGNGDDGGDGDGGHGVRQYLGWDSTSNVTHFAVLFICSHSALSPITNIMLGFSVIPD